jgi:hypothetical protein
MLFVGSKKKGAQGLAIWSWYHKLFIVGNAKLRRARDIRARVWGDVAGIDDLAAGVAQYSLLGFR